MYLFVVDDRTQVLTGTGVSIRDRHMVLSVDDEGAAVVRAMEAGLQDQVRVVSRQWWSQNQLDEMPRELIDRFKTALLERAGLECAQAGRALIAVGPVDFEGPDQMLRVHLVVVGISIPQVKYPIEPR